MALVPRLVPLLWAVGVGIPPSLSAAPPTLQFDLNQVPAEEKFSRYEGSGGFGGDGVPLCGGQDCDGDGLPDFAFSSLRATSLDRTNVGTVTLVWGTGTIGGTHSTHGLDADFLRIVGAEAHEICGSDIWMDDVNGDGRGDLLIGRQNASPEDRPGAGMLTIVLGGSELRALSRTKGFLDLDSPSPDVEVIHLFGAANYDRLGIYVRTGDVDGDGTADVVVGADEVNGNGETNRGAVYVLRGGEHLDESAEIDLAEFGETDFEGNLALVHPPTGSSGDHFGATINVVDLDGNGRAELIVAATLNRSSAGLRRPGAPFGTGESAGGTARGRAFIVWDDWFPQDEWEDRYEIRLRAGHEDVSILRGGLPNVNFGEELIGGADWNDDGKSDLFIGDFRAGVNGQRSGLGYVFFSAELLKGRSFTLDAIPSDIPLMIVLGPSFGAMGGATAAYGDFDGDGIDDLVVSCPEENFVGRFGCGGIYILYGREIWRTAINFAPGQLPQEADLRSVQIVGAKGKVATDEGDAIGYSLAVADMNGDGRSDLIANETGGNGNGVKDVGNVVILSGRALLPLAIARPVASLRLIPSSGSSGWKLEFPTRTGEKYFLEKSAAFDAWEVIGEPILGDGKTVVVEDSLGSSLVPKRFYRVRSELE